MTFTAAAPYLAILVILAVELINPRPRRAGTTRVDRGSFWVIQLLGGGGMFAAFWLLHTPRAAGWQLGAWAAPAGVAVTLFGGAIRAWAIRTLGAYFTRTVQVASTQPVVEAGPYRLIRHPSYTGGALEFLGVGIACGNWVSLACAFLPMALSYAVRIRVEEAALVAALGEPYRAYQTRTKRLIPYVL